MDQFMKTAGLAIGIALTGTLAAEAEQRTLVIASWAPPTHVVNARMWPEFIEMMEEATNGDLTAEVRLNLVPPPGMADLVLDGGADITYIFHGYNTGRFDTAQIIELPGYEGDVEAASVAYWRAWERYLAGAGEQDEFKTVAMFTHGPAHFHLVDQIASLAETSGLTIRAPGGVGSMVTDALGLAGISVPATRVYETLSSRAADGVVMPLDSITSFRLNEVAPHVFEIPGGLYRGSFAVLMNRETWESLTPEQQQVLDSEVFGEPTSRLFGRIWGEGDAEARAFTLTEGNTVTTASAADMALLAPAAEAARAQVFANVAARGVDPQEVHDFIAAEMQADMEARTQ
jgi:TRAP-type C4-dicarboxylate transport system substrate-binding protein